MPHYVAVTVDLYLGKGIWLKCRNFFFFGVWRKAYYCLPSKFIYWFKCIYSEFSCHILGYYYHFNYISEYKLYSFSRNQLIEMIWFFLGQKPTALGGFITGGCFCSHKRCVWGLWYFHLPCSPSVLFSSSHSIGAGFDCLDCCRSCLVPTATTGMVFTGYTSTVWASAAGSGTGITASCIFLIAALLTFNSHSTQAIHLKYTI